MRLHYWLAYLLAASVLIQSAYACENTIIRIVYGGTQGIVIRYQIRINAFVQNGVLSEGVAEQVQCLNAGDTVIVTVTEVNGQPVNFPASGSPKTASGLPGELFTFTITGSAPQLNWRVDTRTCNQTLFDQVYQVFVGGQLAGTSQPIKPGDCFEFSYSNPEKQPIQLVRFSVTPDGNRTNPEYSRSLGVDDPLWYQDGSSSPGLNSGIDNPVGVPEANVGQGKIPYDQTADPATEDTLRKVGDAIYDATAQAGRDTVNELRGVHGKLSAIENEINSGFINVNGKLISVQSALDAINGSVGGLQSSLDGLNATATQSKQVLDNQYAKITSIDGNLETANSRLQEISEGQQSVIQKLGDLNLTAEGLAKESTLSATKSTISSEGANTRDSLATLNTSIIQTRDAVGSGNQINQDGHLGTKTSVDQVKSVLASVYAAIDGARTEANASASAVQGKLDVGNAFLSNIKDNTTALNQNLNGLGGKLDTLSGNVRENTQSTADRLDDVIDLLDHSDFDPGLSGQNNAGSTAGSAIRNQLDAAANSLVVPSIPTAPVSPWRVTLGTVPGGQSWEVDLNPLSYPSVASLAAWLRNVLVWFSTVVYVMACYNVVHQALLIAPAARQTSSASAVPAASSGFALLAAPIITVSLAAIPAVFVAFMSAGGYYSVINANPFGGGDSVIQMGVSLAAAFLPLETIIAQIVLFFVFKIKLGAVYWLACTIVRFIVG